MQPQLYRSKISGFEWWLAIGFFAAIDLAQIVLDLFLIGEVINRFDFIIGGIMALYLWLRGYKFDTNDWLWIAGSILLEEVPIVDAAPLWCLDMLRFRSKDRSRPRRDEVPDEPPRDNLESPRETA